MPGQILQDGYLDGHARAVDALSEQDVLAAEALEGASELVLHMAQICHPRRPSHKLKLVKELFKPNVTEGSWNSLLEAEG